MKHSHIIVKDGVWYPAGAEVPAGEPMKVVLTDDVPEGAMEQNPDGSTNVYDAEGNVVGTISKEELARQQELAGEAWQEQNPEVAEPEKKKGGKKPKKE